MANRNQYKSMPLIKFEASLKSYPINGLAKPTLNNWHSFPTTLSLPKHNETHDAWLLIVKIKILTYFWLGSRWKITLITF